MSLEGYAYWKIRSSPLDFKKLLQMKFLTFFTIILILGQLINFVSNLDYPGILLITSSLNTISVTITFVSLNFGMGCLFVNYKEKNPIRIASSQGASITFLLTLVYMILLIIILFFPLHNYFLPFRNKAEAASSLYITSLVLCSTAIFVFLTSLKLSSDSLRRDF
jgi:ABC-2 type transport system permease protein